MTITSKQKIITLAIAATLFFLMAFLSSCTSSFYLKKAERALKKAEQLGAVIKADTVYKTVQVVTERVKTDTVFQSVPGDTVKIFKDKLRIKYVNLPGDSVYIEGQCDPDTVKVEVPVTVTKEIHAGKSQWWMWLLIGFSVGLILVILLRK